MCGACYELGGAYEQMHMKLMTVKGLLGMEIPEQILVLLQSVTVD
jgi:hypothetical protein